MTIIVFLVDTSASMAQKSYLGVSLLDSAKQAVETCLRQRRSDQMSRGDRYMLMTFDAYPTNVKSGWKEGQAVFTEQLKNLQPTGLSNTAAALHNALRYINLNRLHTGIDNYGWGRYPSYSEPVNIILVTDGGAMTTAESGLVAEIMLANLPEIGCEMTSDAYRWDHRLYSIVLRLPAEPAPSIVVNGTPPQFPVDAGPVEGVCRAMGGRSFTLVSHKDLNPCVGQMLEQMREYGVLIRFEKHGADPAPPKSDSTEPRAIPMDALDESWKNQLVLMQRNRMSQTQSNWPFPEHYWPDAKEGVLPPRLAHPTVLFKCEPVEPLANSDFPFDKYELSTSSPLSKYILDRKEPNVCWQLFVENSHRQKGVGHPFGYLKVSSTLNSVSVIVMPYNYPLLLGILEEARETGFRLTSAFKHKLDKYFRDIPAYYYTPMKRALKKINVTHPLLEEFTGSSVYSYNVISQITKMKHHGKDELESTCAKVEKHLKEPPPAPLLFGGPYYVAVPKHSTMVRESTKRLGLTQAIQSAVKQVGEPFKDFRIMAREPLAKPVPAMQFKNPFDITRENLIGQLQKMAVNFSQQVESSNVHVLEGGMPGQKIKLQHIDEIHYQPIGKMGNYQEYMQSLVSIGAAPLREIEPPAAKVHAFGNPFKKADKSMAVDEVGEVNANANAASPEQQEPRPRRGAALPVNQNGPPSSAKCDNQTGRKKRQTVLADKIRAWKRKRRMRSDASSIASYPDSIAPSDLDSDIESLSDVSAPSSPFVSNGAFDETSGDASDFPNGFRPPSSGDDEPEIFCDSPMSPPDIIHLEDSGPRESFSPPASPTPTSTRSAASLIVSPRTSTEGRQRVGQPPKPEKRFVFAGEARKEVNEKKKRLTKVIRAVGGGQITGNECFAILNAADDDERHILVSYALREAERWKKPRLIHELCQLHPLTTNGVHQQNGFHTA